MAEEGKGKIEKFNGMNFKWWKMQVEDYLYQKDLYLPLVGEKPEALVITMPPRRATRDTDDLHNPPTDGGVADAIYGNKDYVHNIANMDITT
ncbi:hypothetical protein RJ640_021753 [Escallonia rubra]|uniref:Uncharacterized protein n=1 Tax=Escallonia rubra TaxID=112253 RepID=A0AA88QCK0_9ASTE|nr:hypothetical protein RJ640_021753 [Escallonia rubra]